MDLTSRLSLNKPNPDPVTGDFVDISKLNENADKIDAAISATVCTSGTRPASPFQGQTILETDTGRMYARLGSSWVQLVVGGARMLTNVEIERSVGGDWAISGHVTGDTQKRFIIDANGMLQIGPGGGTTPDVNLYRRGTNQLGTDDSFQSGGFCSGASVESTRTSFTNFTTETVIQSVTFNAVSGVGYMVYALQHVQSSIVGDIIRTRLRYASGASVTTAGTLLTVVNPNADVAAKGQPVTIPKLFIAPSTGQFTIGVTMERIGTGTGQAYGDPAQAINTITVVGA